MKYDPKKLAEYFKKNWKDAECSICKGTSWSTSQNIFELREYNGGALPTDDLISLAPVIPITCKTCSQVVFISAVGSEILQVKKEDKDDKNKKD